MDGSRIEITTGVEGVQRIDCGTGKDCKEQSVRVGGLNEVSILLD